MTIRLVQTCLHWPVGHCPEQRVPGTDLCERHITEHGAPKAAPCPRCGNTDGEPLVNPAPVSYRDHRTGRLFWILYRAGFGADGLCWFCSFPIGR